MEHWKSKVGTNENSGREYETRFAKATDLVGNFEMSINRQWQTRTRTVRGKMIKSSCPCTEYTYRWKRQKFSGTAVCTHRWARFQRTGRAAESAWWRITKDWCDGKPRNQSKTGQLVQNCTIGRKLTARKRKPKEKYCTIWRKVNKNEQKESTKAHQPKRNDYRTVMVPRKPWQRTVHQHGRWS